MKKYFIILALIVSQLFLGTEEGFSQPYDYQVWTPDLVIPGTGLAPCPTVLRLKIEKYSGTCSNPPTVIVSFRTPLPLACGGDLYVVNLTTPSGAQLPNLYSGIPAINPGPTTIYNSGLPAGGYTLQIRYIRPKIGDPLEVSFSVNFNLYDRCSPVSLSTCAGVNESCNPGNNGSVSMSFTQPQSLTPYSVVLKKNGVTQQSYSSNSTSHTFSSLAAGIYNIIVTDAFGNTNTCTQTLSLVNNTTINAVDIDLPPFVCMSTPPFSLLNPITTGGTFTGPGVATNIFTAKNAGEGVKTLNYTNSSRPGCGVVNMPVKILVLKSPPFINRVISATAAPVNDQWPTDYTDVNMSTLPANLTTSHVFNSGSKGIWKPEESYVYIEDRKQRKPTLSDPNVGIRLDGIYDTLPLFLYNIGDMAACFPRWRKMNTITKYNPYSNETENKDVLNRKSSALYGYKGDLATAVASNSAEAEIAYNGFEEFTSGQSLTPQEMGPGNLTVFTSSPSSIANQLFDEIQVVIAVDNVLTLNASATVINSLMGKTVNVFGARMDIYDDKLPIVGAYTVSAVNATKKTITLGSPFPVAQIWKGKIALLNNYTIVKDYSQATVSVVTETAAYPFPKFKTAHTGKNSLSLTGKLETEMYKLKVNADRDYVVSGWVLSRNPNDSLTYKSLPGAAEVRGFKLKFYDAGGMPMTPAASAVIEPSGPIIDGWQRLEGVVDLPTGTTRISLTMNDGGNTTLFDDIRIFPETGNIQSYVYNKDNYKVSAVLDNNNYATYYYYDEQGNLFLLKKETERGVKTIQESFSHQPE